MIIMKTLFVKIYIMNIGTRHHISLSSVSLFKYFRPQVLCSATIVLAFTSLLQHFTVEIGRTKVRDFIES